jgi:hypothetical protein
MRPSRRPSVTTASCRCYSRACCRLGRKIYVDWGEAQGTQTIGSATIEPGRKITKLSFGGCRATRPVMFNGKSIGDIDFDAKATLITLEPGICHVVQEVGYGNEAATKAPVFLRPRACRPFPNTRTTSANLLPRVSGSEAKGRPAPSFCEPAVGDRGRGSVGWSEPVVRPTAFRREAHRMSFALPERVWGLAIERVQAFGRRELSLGWRRSVAPRDPTTWGCVPPEALPLLPLPARGRSAALRWTPRAQTARAESLARWATR